MFTSKRREALAIEKRVAVVSNTGGARVGLLSKGIIIAGLGMLAICSMATAAQAQTPGESVWGEEILYPDEYLVPGESMLSPSGEYIVTFQTDGNLVLYWNDEVALWASGTYNQPSAICIMQSDGNLVIYDSNDRPLWASGTYGNPGSYLLLQDDGNLVIYTPSGQPIWATNTNS